VIGFLASNYFGDKLFTLFDRVFARLPIVKLLYSAIKEFILAFAGEKKSFDKQAIVEITSDWPKVVGFITREDLNFLSLSEHVASSVKVPNLLMAY